MRKIAPSAEQVKKKPPKKGKKRIKDRDRKKKELVVGQGRRRRRIREKWDALGQGSMCSTMW